MAVTIALYLISSGLSVEKIPEKCSYGAKGSENPNTEHTPCSKNARLSGFWR
jgi:hypothetical protein